MKLFLPTPNSEEPKKGTPQQLAILRALNQHETAAVGIIEKTMDEEVYRRWARGNIVQDWIASRSFVTEARDNFKNQTLYCELERLAWRWANEEERRLMPRP